jgi:hypothetical protein
MMQSPERFGQYHQILVRARKRCSTLQRLMQLTGKPSPVYASLNALLAESRQMFAELQKKTDAATKRAEKKDDVKRFKAYIASILESDDPQAWMMDVSEAQLCREGGDVNRLYQLFIEGKGKYVLLVDSEMYKEASLREDVFTVKQRKDLAARGEEVAAREAKEEEEAAAAEEKRKLEEEQREKLRKESALREKWAMVGQNVTIHGLTSEKGMAMNGQHARIMYYVIDKDRFEVQLYTSNEKAYLKKANLTVYYGHVPKPKQQTQPKQQQSSPNRKTVNAVRPAPAPSSLPKPTVGEEWSCSKVRISVVESVRICSINIIF